MSSIITIKVVPGSGRQQFTRDKQGNIKCYLKNQAEDNKANVELIKLLAKLLGCAQADLMIVMGATSRTKKIKIQTPLTEAQIEAALGIESQQRLL